MKDPRLTFILASARYWRVTRAQHVRLLELVAAGRRDELLSTLTHKMDLHPALPDKVPACDVARIPWEHGGARNLDRLARDRVTAALALLPPEKPDDNITS